MSTDEARVAELAARLRAAGCVFAEDEARLLLASYDDRDGLDAAVSRRVAGEPLEHVLGFVDFDGRRFRLSPGVFIPRQRSQLLVEEAARLGGRTILDLCCGCGALGLSVQARLPGSRLIASDVSPEAVADARVNGAEAVVGDLDESVPDDWRGTVDLLLCHAPYVPTAEIAQMPHEARSHEPHATLDGGADGMDVQRRLLAVASRWLAPGGHLLTETSHLQSEELADAAGAVGLRPRLVRDEERGAFVLVATRS